MRHVAGQAGYFRRFPSGANGLPKAKIRVGVYATSFASDLLVSLLSFNSLLSGILQREILAAAVFLTLSLIFGQYDIRLLKHPWGSIKSSIACLIVTVLAVSAFQFLLGGGNDLAQVVTIYGIGAAVASMAAIRYCIVVVARTLLKGDPLDRIFLHDGVAPPSAGYVSVDVLGLRPDIASPAALDRIGRILHGYDHAVVACTLERRALWAAVFKGANIQGEIVVPELLPLGPLRVNSHDGCPALIVSIPSLGMRNRILKRLLDLTIAGLALFLLLPILALTAIAIRLDSPGPVLFVQARFGRGNRLFDMYKFRSMRAELCDRAGKRSTARNDQRVTRVGKLIRASSIDELPQLINVLKGDMSIVGPRPHALGSLAGDQLFWEVDARYWHRHAAKPGITGLAQVRGYRGATHLKTDLTNRLQADLEYLNGWSVWRDLSIMISTLRVLVHANAY
ncbi:sugar transferase [Nostoc sp. 3335mG]|nr:sugar transferase [Nostoc sp. 3335mG]